MKHIIALILAIMMITCAVGAFAEEDSQLPELPTGAMGEPPQGGPGGPGGNPPDGAPGDAPGGQQSQVEGQLGSWSLGGTDADSIGGDDYAYDAALYITAEGIDTEKSSTDRISSGDYDETSASGMRTTRRTPTAAARTSSRTTPKMRASTPTRPLRTAPSRPSPSQVATILATSTTPPAPTAWRVRR